MPPYAPMKPRLFAATLAFALLGLESARSTGDFGDVTCEDCKQPTPALDKRGSYNCLCGRAVFVDEPAPAQP